MNKTFILVCLLAVSFHVEKVVAQEELTVPHANDPAWNKAEKTLNAAFRVIRKADPEFKISLAGTYHKELEPEIFDYCIAYDYQYPEGIIDARRAKGEVTTFYTCCSEAYPNTFTFSQPMEATSFGLIAEQRNLDGYLRWAYNSWVESPNLDTRFTAWASGDTYVVYPDNTSSVRFENMIEGIQMFEKMQVLKADAKQARTIQKLLQPFAYGQMNSKSLQKDVKKVKDYLNAQ